LTLTVVPIALVANIIFGVAAAWAIARFDFPGRTVLTALIDLPFAVSPVVAGLIFVLMFGLQGYLGPILLEDGYSVMPYVVSILGVLLFVLLFVLFLPANPKARRGFWKHPRWWLLGGSVAVFFLLFLPQLYLQIWPRNESLRIIFAIPGLVLATAFVTFPFVARELIPVMGAIGRASCMWFPAILPVKRIPCLYGSRNYSRSTISRDRSPWHRCSPCWRSSL